MKLTYLFHSGFSVELEDCILIFDYWMDSDLDSEGYVHSHLLPSTKRIYVFSSHFHEDHFNANVLGWREVHPDIVYIFSKDIQRRRHITKEAANWMTRGMTFKDESLTVRAFGSTDAGVSFYVSTREGSVFHAGDLNNWHWSDESTPEEIEQAEKAYLGELKSIKSDVSFAEVAMFPVDARMGSDYYRGARQFIEQIPIGVFVPMHFSANGFESVRQFGVDLTDGAIVPANKDCIYWPISYNGEQLVVK